MTKKFREVSTPNLKTLILVITHLLKIPLIKVKGNYMKNIQIQGRKLIPINILIKKRVYTLTLHLHQNY